MTAESKGFELLWNRNDHPLNELYRKLVPPEGPAPTVHGEAVRHASKIIYRWFNDGEKVGDRYAETVCYAVRSLLSAIKCKRSFPAHLIRASIKGLRAARCMSDRLYEDKLLELADATVRFCEGTPDELRKETENV